LVGLAVGKSDPKAVADLAHKFGRAPGSQGYCTWYLNSGNAEAAELFNHHYMENPIDFFFNTIGIEYRYANELRSSFVPSSEQIASFASCAEKHSYIALGCQGQQHRGPSVFAMLLAFAGCSPVHAVQIANQTWGMNFVAFQTRLAIAQEGKRMGDAHPELRQKILNQFLK
jgi:hypothetical protein